MIEPRRNALSVAEAFRGLRSRKRSSFDRRLRTGSCAMMATASNEPSISVIFGQRSTLFATSASWLKPRGTHPDVSFGWGYATISLRTKKIKGLHENDFIMASKIDRMFDGLEHPPHRQ